MSNDLMTKPERKDNRMIIYGILTAMLLGTWGYIIYDKSKSKEAITTLQTQFTTEQNQRNEVQDLYNSSLARLDSLTGINQDLNDKNNNKQALLVAGDAEVAKLKSEIRTILSKKNASTAELDRAKDMIAKLNGRITDLAAEVERLTTENSALVATNERITSEKTAVEENLKTTVAEKEATKKTLDETVDVASTLNASNFAITPINTKKSGKEKETTKAKRVDLLRISFDVDDNRIAKAGEKEVYVTLTAPDGSPVTIPAYGSGSFSTRDDGTKPFTSKVSLNFVPGKKNPVSFDWKQDKDFQVGDYKIEVYHNGFKIGESIRNLKKGGLFG